MAGLVGHAWPPPPEKAAQDSTFQRLQQGALPSSRVTEQLQLDPGLDGLSGPQLLDVAQFVVVLSPKTRRRVGFKTGDGSGHIETTRLSMASHKFIFDGAPPPKKTMTNLNLSDFVPITVSFLQENSKHRHSRSSYFMFVLMSANSETQF